MHALYITSESLVYACVRMVVVTPETLQAREIEYCKCAWMLLLLVRISSKNSAQK